MILPCILGLEVHHIHNLCDPEATASVGPDYLVLEEPWSEPDPGPGGAHVAAHPGGEAGIVQRLLADLALVVTEPMQDEVLILSPASCRPTAHSPCEFVWIQRYVPTWITNLWSIPYSPRHFLN